MKSSIALLVVFNHRYDKNLPVLRERYKHKFSNVYYLMPFYDGEDEDVIAVYCKSDTFQGYFTQAYQKLKELNFDYWMVVADDMLLNPKISESNLIEILGISTKDSFVPLLEKFDSDLEWPHARKSLSFTLKNPYVENRSLLPASIETEEKLSLYNVSPQFLSFENIYKKGNFETEEMALAKFGSRYLNDKDSYRNNKPLEAEYPFCFGYSDIFCIGRENLKEFCHYCGVFSASDLFVEIAIPTALIMSTKGSVVQENEIEYRGRSIWGKKNVHAFSSVYGYSMDDLVDNFPDNNLYLHPIKITKWQ